MRRDLFLIFVLGLLVNGLVAAFVVAPGYMDAYYYFGGAWQLARGQGFSEPYVWNYLLPFQSLPIPSHLYWMPLTSLVIAPFLALAPTSPPTVLFRLAQIPMVISASALPLLSYQVATRLTGQRRHAWASALLTLFSAFYSMFWATTDAFALYGLVAGGALWLAGQRLEKELGALWLFLAGICAGLAHLTRADGLLILFTLLLNSRRSTGTSLPFTFHLPLATFHFPPSTFHLLAGYLLIMLPWFIRNWLVIGAPLAPGATRTMWLTTYDDIFVLDATQLTLAHYLATGWGAILQSKWDAVVASVGTLIGPLTSIVGFPFAVIGLWRVRRVRLYRPALVYGVLLFGAMTFVFSLPGARGGLFHSGTALLPFVTPAIILGVEATVEAMARRLPHWRPEKSKPVFIGLLLVSALALTGLIFQRRLSAAPETPYAEVGRWLAAHAVAATATVVVNDPPGFYYFTQHPAIVIPNGGPEDLLEAMRRFDARWLVLDVNHPAGLADLYAAPTSNPQFHRHATFGGGVYLFEVIP